MCVCYCTRCEAHPDYVYVTVQDMRHILHMCLHVLITAGHNCNWVLAAMNRIMYSYTTKMTLAILWYSGMQSDWLETIMHCETWFCFGKHNKNFIGQWPGLTGDAGSARSSAIKEEDDCCEGVDWHLHTLYITLGQGACMVTHCTGRDYPVGKNTSFIL